jgi:Potential Queuosine, Q, salvage protein family
VRSRRRSLRDVTLPEEVRAHAARIVASARSVRIDADRLRVLDWLADAPAPSLDPERHYLEGSEADVATYLLTVAAVNFGSGWFPTLAKRRGAGGRPVSGATTVAWALTDRFRAHGPWTNAQLRSLRATEVAAVLGQRADHELMALYAQALRELGAFLGERSALELARSACGSAAALAAELAGGMTLWADPGFSKRAQLLPHDLELAGLARFRDHDALTIFADNLVPHVLRCDGILVYDELLAARVDAGELLPPGPWEREIRASAVHACALLAPRLGLSEPALDTALWNRGQEPEYKARPRHRCRCVFY